MAEGTAGSMWTSFHAALIRGDRWDEFDRIYGPIIRTWMAKHRLQATDADDLAQQVYLKLSKGLESFDKNRGAFRGWLHTVVRNEVQNYFRQRARHPDGFATGDTAVRELIEQQASEDLASELSGLADSRMQMLNNLQAQCSQQTWNLVIAFHAGQSAAEVAGLYRTTVGAVHQAVYRVKKLAQELANKQQ
jgi:RNA polymerase sigma-70 factor (ECF subfamily)